MILCSDQATNLYPREVNKRSGVELMMGQAVGWTKIVYWQDLSPVVVVRCFSGGDSNDDNATSVCMYKRHFRPLSTYVNKLWSQRFYRFKLAKGIPLQLVRMSECCARYKNEHGHFSSNGLGMHMQYYIVWRTFCGHNVIWDYGNTTVKKWY